MKKWFMAILFGTVLTLGACGDGNESADEGNSGDVDTSEAESIFENNCAECHGNDLEGDVGPDLTSVGSDHSKDEIMDIIQDGQGQMPAQDLDDDDADTVAEWLANKE